MSFWGPALQFGGQALGALSGLFNPNRNQINRKNLKVQYDMAAKARRENNESGPSEIRRGMEAAGFNPVLAYTSGAGHATMQAPTIGSAAYGGGFDVSGIASGISQFGQYLSGASDREADAERQKLEEDYLKAKINALNDGLSGNRNLSQVQLTGPMGQADPLAWEVGRVTVTNPHKNAEIDTDFSDAESNEQRYAEIGSEAAGLRNAYADYLKNIPNIEKAARKSFEAWQARQDEGAKRRENSPGMKAWRSFKGWLDGPTIGPRKGGAGW